MRDEHSHFAFWARVVGAGLVVVAVLILLYRYVDVQALQGYAARLNGGVAFALLTLLPLVGFPANVLQVTAGFRFGFGPGLALVALSILLQLLASYAIVHLWRGAFTSRRLAAVRRKIPHAAHGTVCLFTLLLPGVPYFIQNYTLVLIGIPFRIYLSRCLPLFILRAIFTVGLGAQAGRLTPTGMTILATYWLTLLGASWWTYRRLRRQFADHPVIADGQMKAA